ncbi:MAG: CocE/NonD family hydrolase [Woeseiaceae bacterium]|nr:CocE/NonD family hydrolase [Woeseiaceae bacterium]
MRMILAILLFSLASAVPAQQYHQWDEAKLREELARLADATRKVNIPMRDGVHLSTDVYLPKDTSGGVPAIFWRTPYNYNSLSSFRLVQAVVAVSRGYAFVIQNERGRYFSEGEFTILGNPRTDGYDAVSWIAEQEWSNGRVGTIGCSSSAEWQLGLAAMDHPAHTAMVPMASGAGIGRVGDFHEQGNWYRGGAQRTLFYPWLYGVDNPLRAQIPTGLDRETRERISGYNDLATEKPEVDWKKHISFLPIQDLLLDLGEPPGTFEAFIVRKPGDKGWYEGGLYHDDEGWGVPAFWFNSWYDVSIGPNMALYKHVRENGNDSEVRNNQFAVIAPVEHCNIMGMKEKTIVGARDMGDTRFDLMDEIYEFFDRFVASDGDAMGHDTPRVRYYTMGVNRWSAADDWPPEAAEETRLYLSSDGRANSLYGDGRLTFEPPTSSGSDSFVYDPMNPVQTIGGGDCCNGGTVIPGAFDQRPIQARADVLVYTSEPLEEPLEISGFVDAVLSVSSDARDTDFTVKLVDVLPDGTAYIVDDTILRARYRDGYDREVFMEDGKIYELDFTPMTTSLEFQKGHRIRVEVSSSSFPKYVRNLNTGGNNVDESEGVAATNTIHYAPGHLSYLVLPVVRRETAE